MALAGAATAAEQIPTSTPTPTPTATLKFTTTMAASSGIGGTAETGGVGESRRSTITTPTSSTSTSTEKGGVERLPMPSRNPLPLSASQEAQVREVFNARVRSLCADEIKAFADCARNRTFSIPFACRALSHAMNNCMLAHATPEEHDRAREDWFATRMERARERERKERRKLEQERFLREWWNLPDRDPDEIKREMEKLQRPERIGGAVRRREQPQQPPDDGKGSQR